MPAIKGTASVPSTHALDKALKQTKFPANFSQAVDLSKVNRLVINQWIETKVTKLLGFEDEIVQLTAVNLFLPTAPEESSLQPTVDPRRAQIDISGFLGEDGGAQLASAVWDLMLDAQEQPMGIPRKLLEEKKKELEKRQQQPPVPQYPHALDRRNHAENHRAAVARPVSPPRERHISSSRGGCGGDDDHQYTRFHHPHHREDNSRDRRRGPPPPPPYSQSEYDEFGRRLPPSYPSERGGYRDCNHRDRFRNPPYHPRDDPRDYRRNHGEDRVGYRESRGRRESHRRRRSRSSSSDSAGEGRDRRPSRRRRSRSVSSDSRSSSGSSSSGGSSSSSSGSSSSSSGTTGGD